MPTESPSRRRVSPLSPDDRRAALVEATLPLLREHGVLVNTRQIADAAGVAEGTIFRAFPDKNALFVASVLHGTTVPADRIETIVDMTADLRTRLVQAIDVMTARRGDFGRLPEVMRSLMSNPETHDQVAGQMKENRSRTLADFTTLLAPDAGQLRTSVSQAARILLVMVFSTIRAVDDAETLTSAEIVEVVLDGLLIPATASPKTDPTPTTMGATAC